MRRGAVRRRFTPGVGVGVGVGVARLSCVLGLGLALALAGCGSARPPAKPEPPVRLTIAAPSDTTTVSDATVEVRGRVVPSTATVRVLGRPALVSGGAYSVVVPLAPGANVVDVIASAPHRTPRFAAIRVTREELVTVPDLAGESVGDLDDALDPLGLTAKTADGGGLFDPLIPRAKHVCQQDPAAGTEVPRGSVVHVVIARGC